MSAIKKIVLFMLLILCITVKSQEVTPPVNIQSPNAGAIIGQSEIPVNYNTGVPQISSPLYKLSAGGLDLNISLNYDATGIRINQHSGPVGQNWSLEAGGVITRTVQGYPDETKYNYACPVCPTNETGYFYRGGALQNFSGTQTDLQTLAYNHKEYGYDYEPDIFSFNFMGNSGTFFLGNDNKWKVKSNKNYKIICNPDLIIPLFEHFPYNGCIQSDYLKVIGGFTLIDDNGYQFVFGGDTNAIEYSVDFWGQSLCNSWIANAWHLTKVIDKYGNVLFEFDYERMDFVAEFYYDVDYKNYKTSGDFNNFLYCMLNPVGCMMAPPCDQTNPEMYESYLPCLEGNLISPVYLHTIKSNYSPSNYTIVFNYTESAELKYDKNILDIKYNMVAKGFPQEYYGNGVLYYLEKTNFVNRDVRDNYVNALKWYKLTSFIICGYINMAPTTTVSFGYNDESSQRLNLQEVKICSNDYVHNQSAPFYKYSFAYDRFENIPPYLSLKEDHFGYNKGTVTPFPADREEMLVHYNYRQPDSNYTHIGMLKQITWPTKGYTSFQFEDDDYQSYISDNRSQIISEFGVGGGVRIKSITTNDGTSNTYKSYKYVNNYNPYNPQTGSSGILLYKNKYYWDNWVIKYSQDPTVLYFISNDFSYNSLIPHSNFFGSHIGYSEVAEVLPDNSYTIYKFSNFDSDPSYMDEPYVLSFYYEPDTYFPNNSSPFNKYTDTSIKRGKLLKQTSYDPSSNPVKPVKEITYTYTQLNGNEPTNTIFASNATMQNLCYDNASSIGLGCIYKIYYYDFEPSNIVTKTYNNDGLTYIQESTSISYNTHNLPNRTVVESSLGDANETKTTYIYDHINDSYLSNSTLDLLISKNLLALPLEIQKNKFGNNISKQIGGTCFRYQINPNINFPTLYREFKFESDSPVNNPSSVSFSNGEEIVPSQYGKLNITYSNYDIYGNVTEYTIGNDNVTTILWGYNYLYPVAKIENSKYTDIIGQIGLSYNALQLKTEADLNSIFNILRTNYPDLKITSYTYIPLVGISTKTDQNGIISYYNYDKFNRLETIKDNNQNIIKKYDYHYNGQ